MENVITRQAKESPAVFNTTGDSTIQRRTLFSCAELYLAAQNFI
jgi:hypothetical protein